MVIAGVFGLSAIAIPYVVVPIRRSLGLPTYQWDADPSTHPVSNAADSILDFAHVGVQILGVY